MGKGKLLKYRTKEEQIAMELKAEAEGGTARRNSQGGNKAEDGEDKKGARDMPQKYGTDSGGVKRMSSGGA